VKKPIFIFLVFALLSFTADERPYKIIKHSYDFFTVDNLGNVYTVANDEIRKFNKKGELLKIFSNKKAGRIFSVDASNPLRVLVFYKDQSQVIILDSQLTQNGDPIDLLSLNLEQSDLICSSFNNGIWLYNRQNAELVRLDDKLEKAVSTGNLNNLLNTELKPSYMIENSGYLYLSDAKSGILVFDIYGTYYKTISLFHLRSFQVSEQQLFYYKDSVISSYNTKLLTSYDSLVSKPYPKDMKWMNGTFYKQYADSLLWK
jgi:hypothetical protein